MNQLRGQFEFELADGSKLTCLLNLYALHEWCKSSRIPLSDIDKQLRDNTLEAVPALLWTGVKAACLLEDKEPPMTEQKFRVLFGSTDWNPVVQQVTDSLSLLSDAPQKKTQVRQKK